MKLRNLLEDTWKMRGPMGSNTLIKINKIIIKYHWYEDIVEMKKKGTISSWFQKAKSFMTGKHKGHEEYATHIGEVRIEGRIRAYDRKNWVHDVVVVIPNKFAFNEEGQKLHPTEILKDTKNKTYAVGTLKDTDEIQVRCSCEDYYYTWWYWNKRNNNHYGPDMPRYIRKTATMPERNPKHLPGFCKHITAMMMETLQYSKQADIKFKTQSPVVKRALNHETPASKVKQQQKPINNNQRSLLNSIKNLWSKK